MRRYSKILEICKRFLGHNDQNIVKTSKVGRPARLDDVEIAAISLYQEEMGYCSERDFFIFLSERHPEIATKLGTRRNYNTRRRKVAMLCEKIRQKMAAALRYQDDSIYIVDSMPLPMCRHSRRNRCRIMQDREVGQPRMGRCAAQNEFYYGYKLHAVCTTEGVIAAYDLSPANVHDNEYLKDIKTQFSHCILLGDKGYRSIPKQYELFEYAGIKLHVPYRYNETAYVEYPEQWRKIRKRIEVCFSQLVEQLQIRRNFAKSQSGLFTRVIAKITIFTLSQYVNACRKRPVGQTKHALAALESA